MSPERILPVRILSRHQPVLNCQVGVKVLDGCVVSSTQDQGQLEVRSKVKGVVEHMYPSSAPMMVTVPLVGQPSD